MAGIEDMGPPEKGLNGEPRKERGHEKKLRHETYPYCPDVVEPHPYFRYLCLCLRIPDGGEHVHLPATPCHLAYEFIRMDGHEPGIVEVYVINFQVSHQYSLPCSAKNPRHLKPQITWIMFAQITSTPVWVSVAYHIFIV